jgi:hypothetical protein
LISQSGRDDSHAIREFRSGTRPYVTGIIIALSLLVLTTIIEGGPSNLSMEGIAFAAAVLAILLASAASTKVGVTRDFLLYRPSLWFTKKIDLRRISHSHLSRIGAKPMNLYVFESGRMTATVTIRLRAFSDDDVNWLLSLPLLRITEAKT